MTYETVDLYRYYNVTLPHSEGAGMMISCSSDLRREVKPKIRPAMLIFPGGGYEFLSEREKEPIALKFMAAGFHAFMLSYSLKPFSYPAQLTEAAMAIRYIREHADMLHIDPEHIAAIGFSAGGHLCGTLATCFDDECVTKLFPEKEACRPDAVVLSYPVISSDPAIAHMGSFDNFCAKDPALKRRFSLETRVTERSSPAFLWHTADDDCVPVQNSLRFAAAYTEKKVPYELHVFDHGVHGSSLCSDEVYEENSANIDPHNAHWLDLAIEWLRGRGFRPRTV